MSAIANIAAIRISFIYLFLNIINNATAVAGNYSTSAVEEYVFKHLKYCFSPHSTTQLSEENNIAAWLKVFCITKNSDVFLVTEKHASPSPMDMKYSENLYRLVGWRNFNYHAETSSSDKFLVNLTLQPKSINSKIYFWENYRQRPSVSIDPTGSAKCNLLNLLCSDNTHSRKTNSVRLVQTPKSSVLNTIKLLNRYGKINLR